MRLVDPTGQLLEEGPAELLPTGNGWRYTARATAPAGTSIEAEARDHAGNTARQVSVDWLLPR